MAVVVVVVVAAVVMVVAVAHLSALSGDTAAIAPMLSIARR